MTATDDPQVRPTPAGLSRRDRRDWQKTERARVAHERAELGLPPGKLGRGGRREWRATSRELQKQRLRDARRAAGPDQQTGALIVAVILVVAGVIWWFVSDDEDQAAPAPAPVSQSAATAAAAPVTTPARSVSPAVPDAAGAALAAWAQVTCPLPEPLWPDTVQPLMTADAWANHDTTPPVVSTTWTCQDITVRPAAVQPTDGTVLARWTAQRTVTNRYSPTFTETVNGTRILVPTSTGWLVGSTLAG